MIAPTTPTGLLQGVGENLAGQRILDGLPVERCCHAGVVAQHPQHAAARAGGAADRRAHVEGVEQAQFVEMLLDQVGELEEHLLAFVGLDLRPRALESAPGCTDCPIDVLGIALRYHREGFAGRRVDALERLAGCCRYPLAVDQQELRLAVQEGMADALDGLNYVMALDFP
jgi:hypothetical protein